MERENRVILFAYGTLQLPEVQRANYGRLLEGTPDALAGYVLVDVVIGDDDVVEISGKSVHKIARYTGDLADLVNGTVFELTPAELARTDAYETEDYRRIELQLRSGRTAFVYVEAGGRA